MNKPVCIITGAWWDIWSELATRLSGKYSIALIWRTQTKLEKLLLWLDKWNHKAYSCDITNEKNIKETIKNIISNQWNPSVLINGAAAFWNPKKIHEYTDEEINEVIETNLSWTTKITKEILPCMIQNWWWNIITIWSTCYNWPYSKRLLYAATKRSLQSFTETNALDYKKENIKSNYIFPWPTEWDRVNDVISKRVNESKKDLTSMKESYWEINWWELLKASNTVDAIEMVLNWDLSVLSWSTLWIDNFWIFDESHQMFTNKGYKEHNFVNKQKRKYLFLWKELSSKIQNKKKKSIMIDFLHTTLKISKYAALWLLIFLGSKAVKIDQKAESFLADFKERKFNEKDFNYEFKKIATKEYGLEKPALLLEKVNETQDWKIYDLYFEIGQKALKNIKQYKEEWYNITWIDLDKPIDI